MATHPLYPDMDRLEAIVFTASRSNTGKDMLKCSSARSRTSCYKQSINPDRYLSAILFSKTDCEPDTARDAHRSANSGHAGDLPKP